MQQILNFVIKHRNTLLFLFLLLIAMGLTIQSHAYHKTKFISSTNAITGRFYSFTGGIGDYLNLKEFNERLLTENTALKNKLAQFQIDTTQSKLVANKDSSYFYIAAQVINSSYHKTKNYITINKGKNDSVFQDMGVITDKGIIGIVEQSAKDYARVISLLNTNSRINAQLKKTNHFGSLVWDGALTNVVQLIDIPRLAPLAVGDTIITGGRSTIFPKGIPIGSITSFSLNNDKNYYTVNVMLFNDMTNIGFVQIIENLQSPAIKAVETGADE